MKTDTLLHDFSYSEINANHEIFLSRNSLYKEHGIDNLDLRKSLISLIHSGCSSLLEIGTGKGYLTAMLGGLTCPVVTVDMEKDFQRTAMLNAAYYNNLQNIDFITADAGNMNFDDMSFDTVISAFAFHHFELPFKIIREMARVTEKHLIISDFNERGFEAVEKVHSIEGKTHERMPGDFSIVGVFLKENNFNVTVIEEEWQTIYSAKRS